MCISVFDLSLNPSNSLFILFIHSACLLCSFGCHILFKIFRFLLYPVLSIFSQHLLPVVRRIFFGCFGMTYFVCIILPFVNVSLIFLLSVYFLKLYCYFFCVAFSFLFQNITASFCLIIVACFVELHLRFRQNFLSCF